MKPWIPVLLVASLLPAIPGQAPLQLQGEINKCAAQVMPATVRIQAEGIEPQFKRVLNGSTGVIIDSSGLVLSDADATLKGFKNMGAGKPPQKIHGSRAKVFLPATKTLPARSFPAILIKRDGKTDTSLLQLEIPPHVKVPAVRYTPKLDFRPGAYVLVAGNAFNTATEGLPAISLGIFAAWAKAKSPAGRFITNAPVNRGCNGGPVVDIAGNLVGIVSTYVVDPNSPHFGLGLITHLDILTRTYGKIPAMGKITRRKPRKIPRTATLLQQAYRILIARTEGAVAGLIIDRGGKKGARRYPNRDRRRKGKFINVRAYEGPYSALCVDQQGYLVTSNHSLWGAKDIKGMTVVLADGRKLAAKLVARDLIRGIALLKIDPGGKSIPVLSDLAAPGPGAMVLAIGRPWGGEKGKASGLVVTNGVLSAMHQQNLSADALQHDAGINDAMVGGALINMEGKLLGMLSLGLGGSHFPDRTGRNSGIGFAIPPHVIRIAVKRLKHGKDVTRGWLGISLIDTLEGKIHFSKISKGGPAEKVGVKPKDELVSLAGQGMDRLVASSRVIKLLGAFAVGDMVELVVKRGGVKHSFKVVLGSAPVKKKVPKNKPTKPNPQAKKK